jgi:threonine synthase
MSYQGIIETYKPLLKIPEGMKAITLLEGNTPLIPVPGIAERLGGDFDLRVKFEGLNPTVRSKTAA